jgi:hypothetical protein
VPVLILVLAIAVVVAALIGGYYFKKKRREELATMARQLGLEYSPEDDLGCLGLPFALLERGDGRGTENVIWGTWQGLSLREFDYWYYEESTDSEGRTSRTTYRFSCAVAEIDAACSALTLGRENVLTRLADSIGLPDVQFELEDFNREFTVKCKDRKFANDFVDQRMMRWLLETDRTFSFESSARWLLVSSKRRRPADLIPLLGTLQQFKDQVPRVVFDLYGAPPSA